jgi:hypothetical protein
VATVLQGKVRSYAVLNALPVTMIAGAAILFGQPASLPPALLLFGGVSAYTVAITVYLTGLFPTVLLYNVKVFILYTLLIAPLLVVLLFLSVLHPWMVTTAILLVPLAYYVVQHGYRRWDTWVPSP